MPHQHQQHRSPRTPHVCRGVVVLRRFLRVMWERTIFNNPSSCKPRRYQQLTSGASTAAAAAAVVSAPPLPSYESSEGTVSDDRRSNHASSGPGTPLASANASPLPSPVMVGDVKDSDLVSMKISILGDRHIGKSSFLTKYVGTGKEEKRDYGGISYMDKVQYVQGARLIFNIWELGGNVHCLEDNIPAACKDSVAILFMFDLTSRQTLNSIPEWYKEARKWNQTAIPILIGTKFDDFVQLPMDVQWAIASQARKYAKALNATLFFSSSAYNINVNKVFKFITAKLFNLPWNVERNLTIGEPIIDF